MTVAELRSKMSSYEFQSWVQFYIYEQNRKNEAMAIADAERKKSSGKMKNIKR